MSNKHDDEILQPLTCGAEFGPVSLGRCRDLEVAGARRRGFWGVTGRIVPGSICVRPIRSGHDQAEMRSPFQENYSPCVVPNWDNTPRSGLRSVVFDNATPDLFEIYLKNAIGKVLHKPYQERIVFLKSWNEWAEGNYLEPDRETGWAYLDAIRRVVVQDVPT